MNGLLNLAAMGFAIGIYFWKRWAVYGYGIIIAIFMALNLSDGDVFATAKGIIPIGILIYAVRPIWNDMK